MTATRESIMVAFEALFTPYLYNPNTNPSGAFKTISRVLKTPDEIAPETQTPAVFIMQMPESYQPRNGRGLPAKMMMNVILWVYTNPKADPIPSKVLNDTLDAIDTALRPPLSGGQQNVQTLGGLVDNVWVEGEVPRESGDLDTYGLAAVPVKILVPQTQ